MNTPPTTLVMFAALVLSGSGFAQDKPKNPLQVTVRPALQVRQQFKKLVFPPARLVRFQEAVLLRAVTREPYRAAPLVSNPLMRGEYAVTLSAFDRARKGLAMPKDAKTARRLLDDLDLKLDAVRTALWNAERRAKNSKFAETFRIVNFQNGFSTRLRPARMQLLGRALNGGHLIQIDGAWVVDDGSNPFLRGDYRKAIVALDKTRARLNGERDPKAARRIVDNLTRMLLDVRRELWKVGQARKKNK